MKKHSPLKMEISRRLGGLAYRLRAVTTNRIKGKLESVESRLIERELFDELRGL